MSENNQIPEIKKKPTAGENLDAGLDKMREIGKGMAGLWSRAKNRVAKTNADAKERFEQNKSNTIEPKPVGEENQNPETENNEIKETRQEGYRKIAEILKQHHPRLMQGLGALKVVRDVAVSAAGLAVVSAVVGSIPALSGATILATTLGSGAVGALTSVISGERRGSEIFKKFLSGGLMGFAVAPNNAIQAWTAIKLASLPVALTIGVAAMSLSHQAGSSTTEAMKLGLITGFKYFVMVNAMDLIPIPGANIVVAATVDTGGDMLTPMAEKLIIKTDNLLGAAATGIKSLSKRLAKSVENIKQKSEEKENGKDINYRIKIIEEALEETAKLNLNKDDIEILTQKLQKLKAEKVGKTSDPETKKLIIDPFRNNPEAYIKRLIDRNYFKGKKTTDAEVLEIIQTVLADEENDTITADQKATLRRMEWNLQYPDNKLAELKNPEAEAKPSTEVEQEEKKKSEIIAKFREDKMKYIGLLLDGKDIDERSIEIDEQIKTFEIILSKEAGIDWTEEQEGDLQAKLTELQTQETQQKTESEEVKEKKQITKEEIEDSILFGFKKHKEGSIAMLLNKNNGRTKEYLLEYLTVALGEKAKEIWTDEQRETLKERYKEITGKEYIEKSKIEKEEQEELEETAETQPKVEQKSEVGEEISEPVQLELNLGSIAEKKFEGLNLGEIQEITHEDIIGKNFGFESIGGKNISGGDITSQTLKNDIKESRKSKTPEQIKQQQQIVVLVMKKMKEDNPEISKKTFAMLTASIIRILNGRKSFNWFLDQQEEIRKLILKNAKELSLKS